MGESLIDGVVLSPLKRIFNPKGDVLHVLKRSDNEYVDFGEAYFSVIDHNQIKGWKRHQVMTLNLVVPVGAVRFVIYDDRLDSATANRYTDLTLGQDNYCRLTVPAGLWMSFQGIGKDINLLLNIADKEHDPTEADSKDLEEIPFAW